MKYAFIISILCLFCGFCNGYPVLSELNHSRVSVILKGTYESNDPHNWNTTIYNNDYVESLSSALNSTVSFDDVRLYIDFASINIASSSQSAFRDIPDAEKQNFILGREVLCSSTSALDSRTLRTCHTNNGTEKLKQFFQQGFVYGSTSDLLVQSYKSLAIFIRRFVIFPASTYTASLNETQTKSVFDNQRLEGQNIREFYDYAVGESTSRESRFFPLFNNQLDIKVPDNNEKYILEIRIFMKNLLMKHVNQYTQDTLKWQTFIGFSDWLSNHAYDNNNSQPTNNKRLGGNAVIMARIYQGKYAGNIQISLFNPASCTGSGLAYWAIIKQSDTFETHTFPLAATKLSGSTATIKNVPAGSYSLYITQDKKRYTDSGMANGQDGFPESFQLCQSNVVVKANEDSTVDAVSCVCPSS